MLNTAFVSASISASRFSGSVAGRHNYLVIKNAIQYILPLVIIRAFYEKKNFPIVAGIRSGDSPSPVNAGTGHRHIG